MVLILVMFVPIATYGQENFNTIIIETAPDSNAITVTIEGELDDEGNVMLYITGFFGSEPVKSYLQEYTFTEGNPTHVFDIDYPFLPNEVYMVSAINGYTIEELEWVPLTASQQESASKQDTSENSNTIEEQQLALALDVPTSEQTTFVDSDLVQTLSGENTLLKQEIEKKDAVIMEQIKVIQDLASQISNAVFSNTIESMPHLIALEESTSEQTNLDDSVQSLQEENKLLREEIEKKDAVLMEQLRVIQDLASQLKNAVFEPALNYFSIA